MGRARRARTAAGAPAAPQTWPERYERLAADQEMDTQSFTEAAASVALLWAEMFPTEEA